MIAIEPKNGAPPKLLPAFTALQDYSPLDVNAQCRELGVAPISTFLERINFDVASEEDESSWYSPSLALSTFFALRSHLESNPDLLPEVLSSERNISRVDLLSELRECEDLFSNLVKNGAEFHLVVTILIPEDPAA